MSIPFLSEIFSITLIYWWEPSSLFFRPPTTPLRMMSEYHYTSRPRGLSPPQAGATAALSKGAPREVHVIWAHPKLAQLAHMSPGAAADRVNVSLVRDIVDVDGADWAYKIAPPIFSVGVVVCAAGPGRGRRDVREGRAGQEGAQPCCRRAEESPTLGVFTPALSTDDMPGRRVVVSRLRNVLPDRERSVCRGL